MAALSLAQILGSTRDDVARYMADTLIKNDQFFGQLPFVSTGMKSAFSYDRKVANPAVTFSARDAAITDDTSYTEVTILGQTKRMITQQSVDRSNAGDAGGLDAVKAKRAESSIAAMGLKIGDKLLNGAQAVTGTLVGAALTVANGFSITDVGPNVIAARGNWQFKYTHTGTFVSVRSPTDPDFGTPVAVGTGTAAKVYSYNRDSWVEVTHGSQAMSASDAGYIVMSGGSGEFDGVFELLAGQTDRIIYAGDNGGALAFTSLDTIIGMVKGASRSDRRLIMGERTWVSHQALVRTSGGGITMAELAGQQVPTYNGVPIIVTDFMPITQTRGNTSANTSVICATFGEDGGLVGQYTDEPMGNEPNATVFARGPMGLTVWDLGMSQTAHNSTVRTVQSVALALPNTAKIAVLAGVNN